MSNSKDKNNLIDRLGIYEIKYNDYYLKQYGHKFSKIGKKL